MKKRKSSYRLHREDSSIYSDDFGLARSTERIKYGVDNIDMLRDDFLLINETRMLLVDSVERGLRTVKLLEKETNIDTILIATTRKSGGTIETFHSLSMESSGVRRIYPVALSTRRIPLYWNSWYNRQLPNERARTWYQSKISGSLV